LKTQIHYLSLETPLKQILVCASATGILLLEFVDDKKTEEMLKTVEGYHTSTFVNEANDPILVLKKELVLYFEGKLKTFTVPIELMGTAFRKTVWNHLLTISFGKTITYKQQSMQMNSPLAIRAIASANGRNRIAIVIPCHRVIGSNQTLTGYSGGLWRKQFLLNLEEDKVMNPELF